MLAQISERRGAFFLFFLLAEGGAVNGKDEIKQTSSHRNRSNMGISIQDWIHLSGEVSNFLHFEQFSIYFCGSGGCFFDINLQKCFLECETWTFHHHGGVLITTKSLFLTQCILYQLVKITTEDVEILCFIITL